MIRALALSSLAFAALQDPGAQSPPPAFEDPYPFVRLASLEEVADFEAAREHVRAGEYEAAGARIAALAGRYPLPQPHPKGYVWRELGKSLGPTPNPSPGISLGLLADVFDLHELALEEYERHLRTGPDRVWSDKHVIAGYAARCAVSLGDLERADGFLARAQELQGESERDRYAPYRALLADLRARPDDVGVRVRWLLGYWARQHPPYRRTTDYVRSELEAIVADLGDREAPAERAQLFGLLQRNEVEHGSQVDAAAWSLRFAREVGFARWVGIVEEGAPSLQRPEEEVALDTAEYASHENGWSVIREAGRLLQMRGHHAESIEAYRVFLEPPGSLHFGGRPLGSHVQRDAALRISQGYEALKDFDRAYEYQRAAMETYWVFNSCGFGREEKERAERERLARLDRLRRR